MGVNGIVSNQLKSYYYNNYNMDITRENMPVVETVATKKDQNEESVAVTPKAPAHSDAKQFVFDFKNAKHFNLIGATNKLEDMDVDKAFKDMKKDAVLDQYKFFVGDVNLGRDADGMVRLVQR